MTQQMWGGEAVVTETQPMRDRARTSAPRGTVTDSHGNMVSAPPLPHQAEAVTVTTQQPIVIALVRGVLLALVVAAIDFFTCWQLGFTAQQSAVSAALLFFVTVQGRGVIEGAFDQWRAEKV